MAQIRLKRGTRAQLDAAAADSQLQEGEPYYVVDERRPAVGTGPTDYAAAVVSATTARITVSATAPESPAVGDLWVEPAP